MGACSPSIDDTYLNELLSNRSSANPGTPGSSLIGLPVLQYCPTISSTQPNAINMRRRMPMRRPVDQRDLEDPPGGVPGTC
jgi:hypothetical protein